MSKKTHTQKRETRMEKAQSKNFTSPKQAKSRLTIVQIIGILGSVATVAAFIWTVCTSSNNGSQYASVQTGDNSQTNITQTNDGDINNYYGKTSDATQNSGRLEDLPDEPCPQWLACAYDLVQAGRQTGEFDEAKHVIGEMVKATDIDLQSRCVLQYDLGLAYYYSGEIGSAQYAFQEAVRGGGFPDAFYCLGLTYVEDEAEKTVKDYTKAIDAFTRAIEGGEKPEYYIARAQAYQKNRCFEEATRDMEAAEHLLNAERQTQPEELPNG